MDRNVRDYEVSIWTLQDEFITVLKHSKTENKGRIQDPDFDLKNDGTLTFTFSLPMYLNENGVKVENPIWFNTRNGNIIADLRKVKVIFNKNDENDEAVFEFLITKVTEKHEGFELICEVEAEGLAFYELGKTGYKISLNEDTYLNDWNDWFENHSNDDEPLNNIKYWTDKVLDNTNWTSEVQMDWTGYSGRDPHTIYEDAFAADWTVDNNGILVPTSMEAQKEKLRLISVEESNRYNIIQTIAETFGVHCRFEYEHDENYHIVGRKVIYYNNFIQEQQGELDITYSYNTEEISREIDSKDTVTKMFVKTLQDSNTDSGLATIMDTTANKSGEDYLLNFDYLYAIGNITQEQYDEVPKYEAQMHQFNEQLKLIENQLAVLDDQLIDAQAEETIAKNSISLDQERINATNDLLNALTDNTGTLSVTESRPDTCVAIQQSDGTYYINVRQKGVDSNSIRIYKTYNSSGNPKLTDSVTGIIEYDEFNNIVKISNIIVSFAEGAAKILYLIYDYTPQLYYENIRKIWEIRLAKDRDNYEKQHQLVEDLNRRIYSTDVSNPGLILQKNTILNDKKAAIQRFERLMGPAIREGYWQPEDEYAKYGEKHNNDLELSAAAAFNNNLESIGWDDILFDDEQDISYQIGVEGTIQYYPFVDLSNNLDIFDDYANNLNQISFIYQDISAPENSENNLLYLHFLSIGSQSQLAFLKQDNTIKPILLLTGLKGVNLETIQNCRIGTLTTEINENNSSIININITNILSPATITTGVSTDKIVYPRIRINSSSLKNSEDKLSIKIGNQMLSNYEDYYVLDREDIEDNVSHFRNYITFKPELIFKLGTYPIFNIHYELANTGLMMYLDAKQVLRENAYPKVSYSIKPTLMDENFTRTAYKYLNRIAHINDYELKFENVQGYISELHLMLDSPKDDDIKIENYKTKFEDLFSSIVVQTEQMKKNSAIIGMAASAFTNAGELQSDLVQSVMNRVDLNYAFNNGNLTIDEANGIWGTSDSGVVAFRGGGIFTATEKGDNDEWIWNTGILPSGINASLITTGQLDTNLIRVFAGDDLKLQMNGNGLFAYRSIWNNNNGTIARDASRSDGLDFGQYVVHNGDGLFLRAEKGTSGIEFNFNKYNSNITIAQVQPQYVNDDINTEWDTLLVAYELWNNSYREHYSYEENNEQHWSWRDIISIEIKQFIDYVIGFFSNRFKDKNVIYWFNNLADNSVLTKIKNNPLAQPANAWQDYNILINYNTKEIIVYSYDDNNQLQEEYISYSALTQDVDRVAISWDGLTLRNWNNERTLYADADTGDLNIKGKITATALEIVDNNNETKSIDNYVNGKISAAGFLTADSQTIRDLQNQIDGEIDTWFFIGAPTISGTGQLPSALEHEWEITWHNGYSNDDLIKILRHNSDIYYDIGTPIQSPTAGQAFRFIAQKDNNDNITYYWSTISDTATTAAIAAAAQAQSIANTKIRTFYADQANGQLTPNITPPTSGYGEGDLWVNSSNDNILYRYNGIGWVQAEKKIVKIERQYKRWHPSSFGWTAPATEETDPANNPRQDLRITTRWEELLYDAPGPVDSDNKKISSGNAGITKWSTEYPGNLDKQKYFWISDTLTPWEDFYPDITTEDPNYVVYIRNEITWDDGSITHTDPELIQNLNDAEVKAFNIKNGNNGGIDFSITGNANATVTINRTDGIKVTNTDNGYYFQATAEQMGFFDGNDYPRLGFDTYNNFFINGIIYANAGKIGYNPNNINSGWTIGENSLYSGSASSFDASNGIYLGTSGLSVSGNSYKAHFNTTEFLVNLSNDSAALKIDTDGAVMDKLTVTSYFSAPNLTNTYEGPANIHINNNGGTNNNDNIYFTTLQSAFDSLNYKFFKKNIKIIIETDIIGSGVLIGLHGDSLITITGNTAEPNEEPVNHTITGYFILFSCTNMIDINYLNINNNGTIDETVNISRCSYVHFNNCSIIGKGYSNEPNAAITSSLCITHNSTVLLWNSILESSTYLISIFTGSTIFCYNIKGNTNQKYYCYGDCSSISWGYKRPPGNYITKYCFVTPSNLNDIPIQTHGAVSDTYTYIVSRNISPINVTYSGLSWPSGQQYDLIYTGSSSRFYQYIDSDWEQYTSEEICYVLEEITNLIPVDTTIPLYIQSNSPNNPINNQMWLDSSTTEYNIYIYRNNNWQLLSEIHNTEIISTSQTDIFQVKNTGYFASNWNNEEPIYQGIIGSNSSPLYKGAIWFNTSNFIGKNNITINSVILKLYRSKKAGAYSNAITIKIYLAQISSTSTPNNVDDYILNYSPAIYIVDNTGEVILDSTSNLKQLIQIIANNPNNEYALILKPDDNSVGNRGYSTNYTFFEGKNSNNEPTLEVSYSYSTT